MREVKILHQKELEGSCYVEVQPGKHSGEFWKEESVYFTDDAFFLFTRILLDIEPTFSLWGKTVIERTKVLLTASKLTNLATFLETSPSLEEAREKLMVSQTDDETDFLKGFLKGEYSSKIAVLREFSAWLVSQTKNHSHVTILGI